MNNSKEQKGKIFIVSSLLLLIGLISAKPKKPQYSVIININEIE